MSARTLEQWLAWQETLHPRPMELGLERVRMVAQRLDVLAFSCPVITVGGTNGKGSCVALLEAMLTAGGYRVGAFTSPHLIRYNERIRIANRQASDAQLVAAFERIETARADVSLTFFEFNTLAALLLFKEAAPDAIVLEVGLGGRLDAVNIIDADVALLVTVGRDHCEWLGATLEEIGREKAGIFRPGRPAVLGDPDMPASVFEVAAAIGAQLHPAVGDQSLDILAALPMPPGRQQAMNVAAVLRVLHLLRGPLPLAAQHLAEGLRAVHLPGRFQVFAGAPEWIFDVAHNPQAASALAMNLQGRPCAGRTIAVVGMLADKDVPSVIAPLFAHVDVWIVTVLGGARGLGAAELIRRCHAIADTSDWMSAPSVPEACALAAARAQSDDRIVVFGSFHTVGPALQWKGAC